MSDVRVISVGTPPAFRQQVARALSRDPDGVDWVPSVTAAEGLLDGGSEAADLVVLSPGVNGTDALGLAEFVNRASPATAVVLVREQEPNGLLPAAMRAGVRDVVDLSRGPQELKEALDRAVAWTKGVRSLDRDGSSAETARRGSIVVVFSSKGGTGKSFLAANLAATIAARWGRDTAVVDLDTEMGDLFAYFGEEPTYSFHDLIALGDQADERTVLGSAMRFHEHLWGYAAPRDPSAGGVSAPAVGKVLRAIRSRFEYVVVDTPAAFSDPVLAAFDLADQICLVTGLDVVGVRHLSLALKTMQSIGIPSDRIRIVLNRADSRVGLSSGAVERLMEVRADARVPSSRLVPTSLNLGRPLALAQSRSDVSKSIAALAGKIVAVPPSRSERRRLLAKR